MREFFTNIRPLHFRGIHKNVDFRIVDNEEWYKDTKVIDFLSKVGRNFRMGTMLLKDSVNKRIKSESGMNFAEFTYQIFQANDWLHLFKTYGCKFQV